MPATGLPRSLLAPLVALVAGCAHTGTVRVDPDVTPVLPSPRADVYTRAPGIPNDPLVASVTAGLPWDEAVSGVATAVAMAELAGERVDVCRLRWMAVQAAYPYPVRGWLAEDVPHGGVPERLVSQARAHARGDVDIGLVRARHEAVDRWVLVVGEHTLDLPAIPREVHLGAEVALGEGEWAVSDPLGELRPVEGTLRADIPGEWLVAARSDGRTLATFSIYVGEAAPTVAPLLCAPEAGDPLRRAAALLADLRDGYDFAPLRRDPALDSVARARLRTYTSGAPLPDAREQLRAAGFVGVPVAAASCRAKSVEACVAQMWWSPEDRGALIGDLADYGLAVEQGDGEVRIVVVGAG